MATIREETGKDLFATHVISGRRSAGGLQCFDFAGSFRLAVKQGVYCTRNWVPAATSQLVQVNGQLVVRGAACFITGLINGDNVKNENPIIVDKPIFYLPSGPAGGGFVTVLFEQASVTAEYSA